MKLFTHEQLTRLLDNGRRQAPVKGTEAEHDSVPVVKTAPDPLTRQRITAVAALFAAFERGSGEEDSETNLADLITDLGHHANEQGIDFRAVLRRAVANWYSEQTNPDGDGPPFLVSIHTTPSPRRPA